MSLDYLDDFPQGGCPVTGRDDMIDDCYITVEFGYGSDKDMWTYNLGPVHDSVGKKVLDTIQSMMKEGESVDKFGRDTLQIAIDHEKLIDEKGIVNDKKLPD